LSTSKVAIALALAAVLCGCATAKLGDKSVEAELKKFSVRADKVSLYVCRVNTLMAGGIGTEAFVNGRSIGALKPNTFAHTELAPGEVSIFLRRNGLLISSGDSGALKLDAKAGEVVIIWAGPLGPLAPLTVDRFNTTAEAEECVKKATYAVP
jgi:hypothetical protein